MFATAFSVFTNFILPALLPAGTDALRNVVAKFTGGAAADPQSVSERVQLMNAETARLQALAELDRPAGSISPWVADLRASFRYLAVGAIVLATLAGAYVKLDPLLLGVMLDLSGACMSFIIGERCYLRMKK